MASNGVIHDQLLELIREIRGSDAEADDEEEVERAFMDK